jgi:hypothetical protein
MERGDQRPPRHPRCGVLIHGRPQVLTTPVSFIACCMDAIAAPLWHAPLESIMVANHDN